MCLVIDTCCLGCVFDRTNQRHSEFTPILRSVTAGKGRVIYGGKKYKKELKRAAKFVPIFTELERNGRVIEIPDAEVDRVAAQLKNLAPEAAFDDEHLVALVVKSGCCVVCTDDRMAARYLKRRDLYPSGVRRPKIYRNHTHSDLCCDRYLVSVCR